MVIAFTGIVPRDRDEMRPVSHDDVLALADNPEPGLLKRLHCPEMINTRDLRHR
jgi:hypothetical protein